MTVGNDLAPCQVCRAVGYYSAPERRHTPILTHPYTKQTKRKSSDNNKGNRKETDFIQSYIQENPHILYCSLL